MSTQTKKEKRARLVRASVDNLPKRSENFGTKSRDPCEVCLCVSCEKIADCPVHKGEVWKTILPKYYVDKAQKAKLGKPNRCSQLCTPCDLGKGNRGQRTYFPLRFKNGTEETSCPHYVADTLREVPVGFMKSPMLKATQEEWQWSLHDERKSKIA